MEERDEGGGSARNWVDQVCAECVRGEGEEEETTCRNNVRVFDLRHVTEPH